jgi:hypothetical protein
VVGKLGALTVGSSRVWGTRRIDQPSQAAATIAAPIAAMSSSVHI